MWRDFDANQDGQAEIGLASDFPIFSACFDQLVVSVF
jgi:hypothetical protein